MYKLRCLFTTAPMIVFTLSVSFPFSWFLYYFYSFLPHFSSFFYVYFFSFSPCLQAETKIIIFAAYGIVVQK